jgi:hypothetical protein
MGDDDEYEAFVAHPRYGRGPRVTGLNPTRPEHTKPGMPLVKLHWHSGPDCRIPNTAIVADVSKQNFTTMPVTHYFDAKRTCQGCSRPFLFFAEEQRHWYEELGFPLDANCVRCVPCRKQEQGIAQKRQRYEELFHVPNPTDEELLEMAECCLSLIEASVFSPRQHERVRMLLHRVPDRPRHAKRRQKLLGRVRNLEKG